MAILDADKEGYLRSQTSLIQTIGRAARNVEGTVIMYADEVTDSMRRAIDETQRRRMIQLAVQRGERHQPDIHPEGRLRHPSVRAGAEGSRSRPSPRAGASEPFGGSPEDLRRLILQLEEEMHQAAEDLRFEYAARIRDEIHDLKRELRDVG